MAELTKKQIYQKEYRNRPEVKAKKQSPEFKAKRKANLQRPKSKARRKAKRQTEEWKARRKVKRHKPEYTDKQKAKRHTPEFRAKHRRYMKARRQKKKKERALWKEYHSIPAIKSRLKAHKNSITNSSKKSKTSFIA